MAKLVQYWNDRSSLVRGGICWAFVFQVLRIVYWYITQNISFTSVSSAASANYVAVAFTALEAVAVLIAIIGMCVDFVHKRVKKDDGAVKMAEGIWMIKK